MILLPCTVLPGNPRHRLFLAGGAYSTWIPPSSGQNTRIARLADTDPDYRAIIDRLADSALSDHNNIHQFELIDWAGSCVSVVTRQRDLADLLTRRNRQLADFLGRIAALCPAGQLAAVIMQEAESMEWIRRLVRAYYRQLDINAYAAAMACLASIDFRESGSFEVNSRAGIVHVPII